MKEKPVVKDVVTEGTVGHLASEPVVGLPLVIAMRQFDLALGTVVRILSLGSRSWVTTADGSKFKVER